MANKCLLILVVGVCSVAAYTGLDLPPGPYCGTDRNCCTDRQDGCSHPILDTICYCDEFCNRTASHDDCCPDYLPVCHGEVAEIIAKPTCTLDGRLYLVQESAFKDCNKCQCIFDEYQNKARWECEQDECIISQAVLDGVRRGASWRAANYTEFAGKKLKEGLIYKLGTLPLSPATRAMYPIIYDKDIDYPTDFDARKRWPSYITPVRDQGWCGSDWAITLTGVASDRFAIQSNGAEKVVLSPQTLLSCNVKQQRGCDGGHIDVAWIYAMKFGLVDEDCLPYKAARTQCPFRSESTLQEAGCRPSVRQRTTKYQVGPVGLLRYERDIMYDIMETGPVFAIMSVYQDFFHYRDGIYRRSNYGDTQMMGLHSVRVVGWGQERGEKYWVVANSWGTEWGENGYFRIARGSNESGIESFVVSATSEVQASQRK